MKLLTVLAATATAAAIAAAITIPAGAADQGDQGDALAACMRTHGADVPAGLTGLPLKQWVSAHASDKTVSDALATCQQDAASPPELVSCLKAHGIDPPSSLMALKPFLADASRNPQLKAALKACGVDEPKESGMSPKDLATCLSSHGATGVPDGSDPMALKEWIGAHADQIGDALRACDVGMPDDKKPGAASGCAAPAPAETPAEKNSSE